MQQHQPQQPQQPGAPGGRTTPTHLGCRLLHPNIPLHAPQELLCDLSLSNIDIIAELERVDSDEAARTKLLSSEAARDALAARLTQVGAKNTAQPSHSKYLAAL